MIKHRKKITFILAMTIIITMVLSLVPIRSFADDGIEEGCGRLNLTIKIDEEAEKSYYTSACLKIMIYKDGDKDKLYSLNFDETETKNKYGIFNDIPAGNYTIRDLGYNKLNEDDAPEYVCRVEGCLLNDCERNFVIKEGEETDLTAVFNLVEFDVTDAWRETNKISTPMPTDKKEYSESFAEDIFHLCRDVVKDNIFTICLFVSCIIFLWIYNRKKTETIKEEMFENYKKQKEELENIQIPITDFKDEEDNDKRGD